MSVVEWLQEIPRERGPTVTLMHPLIQTHKLYKLIDKKKTK